MADSDNRLTKDKVESLAPPATGNKVIYDGEVRGFGCRVTKAGAKSFVLNYRVNGIERRMTIGGYPTWTVAAARKRAAELRQAVDSGLDPLALKESERTKPTVKTLAERYIEEHLPRKRPASARDDKAIIAKVILPALGKARVADLRHTDIDALHRKLTKAGTPIRANRAVALLSKMLSLSVKWEMRSENPAKGIERNPENKRRRYLSGEELAHLSIALVEHKERDAANVVRLLLLTGARRGEVLAARWDNIDLETGVWTKPGATTKQKSEHRVPLSGPARSLLSELYAAAEKTRRPGKPPSSWVFPGTYDKVTKEEKPLGDIKNSWATLIRRATVSYWQSKSETEGAKLVAALSENGKRPSYRAVVASAASAGVELKGGIMDVRVHDLRHTYASILASAGLSLHLIGGLLGHTQPSTTARYAHLFDDPLRAATERVGLVISDAAAAASGDGIPSRSTT